MTTTTTQLPPLSPLLIEDTIEANQHKNMAAMSITK